MARCADNPAKLLRAAKLSERQIRCLSAYYFDGMSQQQIAQVLGIGQDVVSRHMQAGEERLKQAGLPLPSRRIPRKTITMDPQRMDRLGPRNLKAIF